MTKAFLTIFLMTEASIQRILAHVILSGFSIEPWLNNNKLIVSFGDSSGSIPIHFKLIAYPTSDHPKDFSYDEMSKQLIDLFRHLDIPYYGFCLSKDPPDHISVGHMPSLPNSSAFTGGLNQ